MSLEADKQLIRDAMSYRSGEDHLNTVYMGSHAIAGLYHTLGLIYGHADRGGFEKALSKAGPTTVHTLLKQCQHVIDYMRKHPTKKCPHCGQIMSAKEGAS